MRVNLDPRDGPTENFKRHHDVVDRSNGQGKRVRSRLELLLETGYISAVQSEAGRRWTRDYLICFGGGGRSCLDVGPRGVASWNPSEQREDASRSYMASKEALDGTILPQAVGLPPSEITRYFCVEDESFATLGERMNVSPEFAKARVSQCLTVLALHYESEDSRAGRSATLHTSRAALARFDPDAKPVSSDSAGRGDPRTGSQG